MNNDNTNQTNTQFLTPSKTPFFLPGTVDEKKRQRKKSSKPRKPSPPENLKRYAQNTGNYFRESEDKLKKELFKVLVSVHKDISTEAIESYVDELKHTDRCLIHGALTGLSFPRIGKTSDELVKMINNNQNQSSASRPEFKKVTNEEKSESDTDDSDSESEKELNNKKTKSSTTPLVTSPYFSETVNNSNSSEKNLSRFSSKNNNNASQEQKFCDFGTYCSKKGISIYQITAKQTICEKCYKNLYS
jgi:hypothetical protein